MKNKVIGVLILIMVSISAYLLFSYNEAVNTEAPVYNITVNGEEYIASTTQYQVKYWGGYIEKEESIFLINPIKTDTCLNKISLEAGRVIEITENENYYLEDMQLVFTDNGEYAVDITVVYDDNTLCIYRLMFTVDLEAKISISNLNPVQGDLITVEVSDIISDDILEVECEFSPSFIQRDETSALFYIPVNYKYEPESYNLELCINDDIRKYEIEVADYEFTEIHFTVSAQVTDSTKKNPDAGPEYRSLVWPLYDTYSEEIYWEGNLMKPVEEKRISSAFGQYRYINDAVYPSRHSGIDYAADCGTEIVAAADGIVDISETLILSGGTVVIDHGLGVKSYYFHMQDLSVSTGDLVEQGQLIAHVGKTGYATGCHLHYQVSIKNQPVNPELLYK